MIRAAGIAAILATAALPASAADDPSDAPMIVITDEDMLGMMVDGMEMQFEQLGRIEGMLCQARKTDDGAFAHCAAFEKFRREREAEEGAE